MKELRLLAASGSSLHVLRKAVSQSTRDDHDDFVHLFPVLTATYPKVHNLVWPIVS